MKIVITPKIAKEMLEKNTNNRKVNEKHVVFLSRQMTDGEWVYNGQSVVVSADGVLLDGQHRLLACVDSGVQFETELIDGVVSEKAFSTIDTGRIRTANDLVGMGGGRNSHKLTAIARIILEIAEYNHNDGMFRMGHKRKFTNNEILDFVANHNGLEDFVAKTLKFKTPQVAILFILSGNDNADVLEFISKYNNGLFDNMNCPVKKLMEWTTQRGTNFAIIKTESAAVTIKAFKAFKKGQLCKRLSFKIGNEKFPLI